MEKETWPSNGIEFNLWFHDAAKFVQLIEDNQGFWVYDYPLKYLSLTIDTRGGRFTLRDRDGNTIHPDRVVAAINRRKRK